MRSNKHQKFLQRKHKQHHQAQTIPRLCQLCFLRSTEAQTLDTMYRDPGHAFITNKLVSKECNDITAAVDNNCRQITVPNYRRLPPETVRGAVVSVRIVDQVLLVVVVSREKVSLGRTSSWVTIFLPLGSKCFFCTSSVTSWRYRAGFGRAQRWQCGTVCHGHCPAGLTEWGHVCDRRIR